MTFICETAAMLLPIFIHVRGRGLEINGRKFTYRRGVYVGRKLNVNFDGKTAVFYVKKYDDTVTFRCEKFDELKRISDNR